MLMNGPSASNPNPTVTTNQNRGIRKPAKRRAAMINAKPTRDSDATWSARPPGPLASHFKIESGESQWFGLGMKKLRRSTPGALDRQRTGAATKPPETSLGTSDA